MQYCVNLENSGVSFPNIGCCILCRLWCSSSTVELCLLGFVEYYRGGYCISAPSLSVVRNSQVGVVPKPRVTSPSFAYVSQKFSAVEHADQATSIGVATSFVMLYSISFTEAVGRRACRSSYKHWSRGERCRVVLHKFHRSFSAIEHADQATNTGIAASFVMLWQMQIFGICHFTKKSEKAAGGWHSLFCELGDKLCVHGAFTTYLVVCSVSYIHVIQKEDWRFRPQRRNEGSQNMCLCSKANRWSHAATTFALNFVAMRWVSV